MMMRAAACALSWKLLRGLMSSCMTGLDDTCCSVQFLDTYNLWSVGHDDAPRANLELYSRLELGGFQFLCQATIVK